MVFSMDPDLRWDDIEEEVPSEQQYVRK